MRPRLRTVVCCFRLAVLCPTVIWLAVIMTIGIHTMVSANLEAPHSSSGPLNVVARTAKIEPTDQTVSFVEPLMVWMTRWKKRFIHPTATGFRVASMAALGLHHPGKGVPQDRELLHPLLVRGAAQDPLLLPLVRAAAQDPLRLPLVKVAEQGNVTSLSPWHAVGLEVATLEVAALSLRLSHRFGSNLD